MNKEDKKAFERYQKKLELVRSSGGTINPYETEKEKKARIQKAKKDIKFCVEYYFPHYATSESADFHIKAAKKVLKDKKSRMFFQWGRGLAKSVWADVIIPFWLWINDEVSYMVVVTTSSDRAAELLDDLQAEFEENERIINDFGEQKNSGKWESGNWTTNGGFTGRALGAGQSVRGLRKKAQRPDFIVVDDLETKETIANEKRQRKLAKWIERDLIPTMDGYPKRFIYANNRFAPTMIQTILQERHPNWKVHEVKAYDPVTYFPTWHQKYDVNYYKEVEDDIGVLAAKAEYNNEPHVEGVIFKEEHIQWTQLPRINTFKMIIGHWDIAYAGTATADYNAVRVWGVKGKEFYYIDSFVKQSKMRSALEWIAHFQMSLPENVFVHWQYESQFWNDEVERTIEEVEDAYDMDLHLAQIDTPTGKKYDRILKLHPYYQNGRIYYNQKKKSHKDTQVALSQLYGIEPGYSGKDDAPDADHQAITGLSKYVVRRRNSGNILTGTYQRQQRF